MLIATTVLYLSCKKTNKYGTYTDRCKGITCQNGGTCNTNLGYCECPYGYGGEFCEYKCPSKDEFLGTYIGKNQKYGDTVVVSANSNDKKLDVTFTSYGNKLTFVCDLKSCGFSFLDTNYTYLGGRHLDGGLNKDSKQTLNLTYRNLVNADGPGTWKGTRQ
ncbi:MAG: hypothetical protein JNK00_13040 [Flavipsychrobacter sp.]|nr:hypothetical protein [Flavipsychrobacter sp.]